MEKTKKCRECKESKELTLFNYKKTSLGRAALREMCKACERRIHRRAKHRTR